MGRHAENETASKETLRKRIRNYIQHQIASGRFQAGDRIVETQLARELNVSQAPVREAILELAAMGLLEERPYSGSFVRKLTAEDVEDIYNTRAFLDEYAARQAARNITEQQLVEMEALLQRMDEAEDYQALAEMDMDAAGSPALKRTWENLRLVEWTELSAAVTQSTLEELAKQHWRLFQLLKQHADHAAGAYMFIHIKNFGEELKRYLQQREASESSSKQERSSL